MSNITHTVPPSTAHRPVPVTSDMELSVMKNKIAELKAQLNKDFPSRERSASSSGDNQGFTFVSLLLYNFMHVTMEHYYYYFYTVCVRPHVCHCLSPGVMDLTFDCKAVVFLLTVASLLS